MKKRIMRANLFAFLIAGILMLQGCFTFKVTDKDAAAKFAQKQVQASFANFEYAKGKQIHYVHTGDTSKPLLFFIHGSPGAWDAFEIYLADSMLLQHYQMVSVDRPGFGHSNFGRAENLEDQSEVFVKLATKLSPTQPVYLIGHSLGGPAIALMAAKHPKQFAGIFLLAASVDPKEEPKERWRAIVKSAPLRWLMPGAFRPSNDELYWFKQTVNALPAAMANINCPVIIVHGTKDQFVPYRNALFSQTTTKKSSAVYLATLEGANHFIPWSHFENIKALIIKFAAPQP